MGIAARAAQSGQPTFCQTRLIPPHGPRGAVKRAGNVVLIGPSLLHEVDDPVSLGHVIVERELRNGDAGDNHHAVSTGLPQETALVDGDNVGRSRGGEQLALRRFCSHAGDCAHRAEKADSFGFAPRREADLPESSLERLLAAVSRESASGYVRRSGFTITSRRDYKSVEFCPPARSSTVPPRRMWD